MNMKKINDSNKDVLEALYVFDWLIVTTVDLLKFVRFISDVSPYTPHFLFIL